MKHSAIISRKLHSFVAAVMMCMAFSSCGFMEDVVQGMANYPMYGYGMASGYSYGYSASPAMAVTTSTSSTSSTSSAKTCSWCRGTGNCRTCNGTGRKYDYGTASLVTHEKYEQRCGVCRGTGRCGVCN